MDYHSGRVLTAHEVNARVEVDELNEKFNLDLPSGDYQTLSGLILFELGHIPKRGEKLKINGHTLLVLSHTRRMVKWVRLTRGHDS